MHQVYETETTIYLILELCSGGNLAQRLRNSNGFDEDQIHPILLGLLKGIKYLHEQKIIHRDLKIDNILFKQDLNVNAEENVKIVDFGLSTHLAQNSRLDRLFVRCGTPGYIAPEVLTADSIDYDEKCDVFSLGIILHIMYN